jgi:hypothetical protein
MAKPVTGRTVFGSSTTGTTTELDNNFLGQENALNDLNSYSNYLVDSGAANAYEVTLGASLTGPLTAGLMIQMKAANTNTGASTLNYNATGVLAIQSSAGSALGIGQIRSGGIYNLVYTGSVWQLQTPSAPSGSVLIATANSNGNTTIDFNASMGSTYDQYLLTGSNITVTGNQSHIAMRFGNGNANAGAYAAANYQWSSRAQTVSGTGADYGSTGNSIATGILLTAPSGTNSALGNAANQPMGFSVTIFAPNSNNPCGADFSAAYINAANGVFSMKGGGMYNLQTGGITSVQILPSNGNMRSGNFAIYGLSK